ncbi:MAG TPA: EAL domain-containing protein [Vicinamibacteria bacterium]|nr:EAL domain-containing protein [Vicinamibacteria bacterium]
MPSSRVPPDASPAHMERFEQFVGWLLPLTLGFAALQIALLRAHPSGAGLWAIGTTVGYAGLTLLARRQARRQRLEAAVTLTCGGLLAVGVLGVIITPGSLPTLVVIPLLAVMVALTFGPQSALRRFMPASWIAGVLIALVGEWLPRAAPSGWLVTAYRVATVAAVLGLSLLLLWQFSRRLTEALAEMQAANLSLHEALAEVRMAEEKIKDLAYHDTLTALPNRLVFTDRLALAVNQAQRQGSRLAVLFLDLDHFKVINDSLGHSLGDLLLQQVAARLTGCLRAGDTVARLGGDEFTLLLPGVQGPAESERVAGKVLDTLREPFRLEGRELFVTASMGISLYPDDGEDTDTLVRNADAAMYRAKEQGRDSHRLYAPPMNEMAGERLALESALRRALAGDELVLHYQPLVEIGTGRLHGVEALLRWRHPEKGLLWPSDFLALAESTGIILPIGPWVLRTACAQAQAWHAQDLRELRVAVNLSARQFQQPDLAEHVQRALRETGLPPPRLELEITETSAMQNTELTARTFRELKALGVRISIDDFGVGYSSLGTLKRLPIDTIKIDRSVIRDITTDPDDAAIVTAIIAMAHTLELKVVAEGVDTEEQLTFLRGHGCDLMQGHLFGPAAPAEECGEGLARHGAGFHARAAGA